MDNTRKMLPVFLLNWHHIPIAAHGDNGLLEILLILSIVQNASQMVLNLSLASLNLAPDTAQLYTSIIPQAAMLIHHILQIALQLAQDFQIMGPAL